MARRLVEDPEYVELLAERLRDGKAPHMETLLFHYAYGKPAEKMELTGESGGPVVMLYVPQKDHAAH